MNVRMKIRGPCQGPDPRLLKISHEWRSYLYVHEASWMRSAISIRSCDHQIQLPHFKNGTDISLWLFYSHRDNLLRQTSHNNQGIHHNVCTSSSRNKFHCIQILLPRIRVLNSLSATLQMFNNYIIMYQLPKPKIKWCGLLFIGVSFLKMKEIISKWTFINRATWLNDPYGPKGTSSEFPLNRWEMG